MIPKQRASTAQTKRPYSIGAMAFTFLFAALTGSVAMAQCPSVTLGTNPTVCGGTTGAAISLSGLTGGIVHTISATYNYTGAVQTYTVPTGVKSFSVDIQGAAGQTGTAYGGHGGRVQGALSVTSGQVLNLYVGGISGFNGGGAGSVYGGRGGDASDIRTGGVSLSNRVIVAGGGGGGGASSGVAVGGAGGNTTGGTAINYVDAASATGGTQTSGGIGGNWYGTYVGTNGSLGQGGTISGTIYYGGGGGGGFYGGGGGGYDGGGGGSSYTNPSLVTGVSMTQGYNAGNGSIYLLANSSPYTYSIVWSSAALAAGFTNSADALFDTSTLIYMAIPLAAPVAVYTATLTLSNGTCSSPGYIVSVNVTPSVTLGSNPSVCAGTSASLPFSYVGCSLLDTVAATFNYTGAVQTYTVPTGITSLNVDIQGAVGQTGTAYGGHGGRVQGALSVTSGEVLNLYVGGISGFNGGGAGSVYGGRGGDASDIRTGGVSLANRVIVAGGGGGGGASSGVAVGGAGGNTTGGTAINYVDAASATGGTQTGGGIGGNWYGTYVGTNGSIGQGGTISGTIYYGGGGGGGFYGGGGGGYDGGGGGSSYANPSLVSGVSMTQGYNAGLGSISLSGLGTPVYTYNIAWSSAAITAGFSNVTGASLTGSAINITTPVGASVAVYTATVTISHSSGLSSATYPVSVTILPAPTSITGASSVCQSVATSLSDAATGGTWSSDNTTVATVGSSSGLVTGLVPGTTNISYTTGCGTAAATVITVNGLPAPGAISGPSIVTTSSNITLTDAVSGGVWSASNSNATVSGGVVTGVTVGSVTISYSVTGGCGTAFATKAITVSNYFLPAITGTQSYVRDQRLLCRMWPQGVPGAVITYRLRLLAAPVAL